MRRALPQSAEVSVLLAWMGAALRGHGTPDWDRAFCASMIARARRGPLHPSDRQLAAMRRIVRDFRARVMDVVE